MKGLGKHYKDYCLLILMRQQEKQNSLPASKSSSDHGIAIANKSVELSLLPDPVSEPR